jgi:hypothetical protein
MDILHRRLYPQQRFMVHDPVAQIPNAVQGRTDRATSALGFRTGGKGQEEAPP